jgi:hypothetical protein
MTGCSSHLLPLVLSDPSQQLGFLLGEGGCGNHIIQQAWTGGPKTHLAVGFHGSFSMLFSYPATSFMESKWWIPLIHYLVPLLIYTCFIDTLYLYTLMGNSIVIQYMYTMCLDQIRVMNTSISFNFKQFCVFGTLIVF